MPKQFLLLIFISLIFFIRTEKCFAQIEIQNPSFEGTAQPDVVPYPWQICSPSPDTDPCNLFPQTFNLPASDGDTYCGMGVYSPPNNYYEEVSQKLICSLVKGAVHQLNIDLAYIQLNGTFTGGQLRIYGGFDVYDKAQLLWQSSVLNTFWQTYNAEFIPNENYNYIILSPYIAGQYQFSYIAADNMSPTIQVDGNAHRVLAQASSINIYNGECIQLSAHVLGTDAVNATWSSIPLGWFYSTVLNPGTVCPTQDMKYILTITDTCGLTSTDTAAVKVEERIPYIIPSILRPITVTGEDKFYISGLSVNSELSIYNILGQQLFHSSDYKNDFSVSQLPASLYFYQLKTSDENNYEGKFEVVR